MPSIIELVIIILLTLWCVFLTLSFRKMQKHYNSLVSGEGKKTLTSALDDLMREGSITKKDVAKLIDRCDKIEKDSLFHIQKVGLLRFNPFNDTGGDQSFIIALLNAKNTGIVISGLYSRTGTRWYAKRVKDGQGDGYVLSDEEKKTIVSASN